MLNDVDVDVRWCWYNMMLVDVVVNWCKCWCYRMMLSDDVKLRCYLMLSCEVIWCYLVMLWDDGRWRCEEGMSIIISCLLNWVNSDHNLVR